jgi:hypothetical protein
MEEGSVNSTSVPLLLAAAATVGFLHSILPDHWAPLAVVARTQRWSVVRVARISFLASVGHVVTSIALAGLIALVGLQFRHSFESAQGHIVGAILVLTGVGFLVWGMSGSADHDHAHEHHHDGDGDHHHHDPAPIERHGTRVGRLAAIVGPFGAAASPDLTILPIALAASAVGVGAVLGALAFFTLATLATFVTLTVAATLAGYQIRGDWLESHGTVITAAVLIAVGIAVFAGL